MTAPSLHWLTDAARLSIRSKLALGFGGLVALAALFIFLYFPAQLEQHATRAVAGKARSLGEMTAYTISPAVFFNDGPAIEELLAGTRHSTDVLYIRVQDEDGHTLALFERVPGRTVAPIDAPDGITPGGEAYHVSAPVRFQGEAIGTIALGFSLDEMHHVIDASRAHIAIVSTLVLLVGFLIVCGVSAVVTRPLSQIVATVERITAGDLSQRVPITSRDEVASLARSFNTMVERLETAYGDLQHSNRDLEERVHERTAELRQEMQERVRTERLLRESEQRFRAIFESAALGIALLDEHGYLFESNPALQSMLGRSAEELAGTTFGGLVHPDDLAEARERVARIAGGETMHAVMELRAHHKDGSLIWGHGTFSVVRDAAGRVLFRIGMVENITQQKQLEEQVRQSQKLEAVGRLAGGVAHDFNNLLTTIIGTSDLVLSEMPATDPLRPELEEIIKAGERAASLTRQLLAFSRRQILQPKVLCLNDAVDDLARMLRRLIGEDIELVLDLQPSLPSVVADPGQMTQVLMNLAVNARDAMATGGRLVLRTRAVEIDKSSAHLYNVAQTGPHVRITVSDTGHGIEPAIQPHIFEPFFTTKELGKGTGLGLATVYGIVKQSGGGIAVESEPGHGASFHVVLPAVAAEEGTEAADPIPVRRGSETLLVVEDEDSVRLLVRRVLQRYGYEVLEARDGIEALRVHETHGARIQGVVTDLVMPRMSGHELVQRLRLRQPDLPVLYLSGYTEDQVVREDVRSERVAFVQKPVAPAELAAKVRHLLDTWAAAGVPVASL